jgi:hypothetical protein
MVSGPIKGLDAVLRWAWTQGLIERKLALQDLFAPDVLAWEPLPANSNKAAPVLTSTNEPLIR